MTTQAQPQAPAQVPVVGAWYRDPLQRDFEVVAIDEEAGVIQVRYHDDEECSEMKLADWRHVMVDRDAMPEEVLTPPEDDAER